MAQLILHPSGSVFFEANPEGPDTPEPEVVGSGQVWDDGTDSTYARVWRWEDGPSASMDMAKSLYPGFAIAPSAVVDINLHIRMSTTRSAGTGPRAVYCGVFTGEGPTLELGDWSEPDSLRGEVPVVDDDLPHDYVVPVDRVNSWTSLEQVAVAMAPGSGLRVYPDRRSFDGAPGGARLMSVTVYEAFVVIDYAGSTVAPPCRLYPRTDNLGNTPRIFPRPDTRQRSPRNTGTL